MIASTTATAARFIWCIEEFELVKNNYIDMENVLSKDMRQIFQIDHQHQHAIPACYRYIAQ